MEEQRPDESILNLNDELILDSESGGEDAIERQPGVLLLSDELPPEPVIRKIDVGPRVSAFAPPEPKSEHELHVDLAKAWRVAKPVQTEVNPAWRSAHSLTAAGTQVLRPARKPVPLEPPATGMTGLARMLAEARASANEYGAMKARTRKALYEALGRTYDFTICADEQPAQYASLIEAAGLTVQDRAPYSPIIKLVFGADHDKTRVAEFAAAINYGRRKGLPLGSFSAFLDQFDGGLKAVVGLERLFRSGLPGGADDAQRSEARPAIAGKLREITAMAWSDIPAEGDEFALVLARRQPDGSVAMVGEVPRDIALLEKAARRLLAEIDRAGAAQAKPAKYHPEGV
jgi:hypothetical protein